MYCRKPRGHKENRFCFSVLMKSDGGDYDDSDANDSHDDDEQEEEDNYDDDSK